MGQRNLDLLPVACPSPARDLAWACALTRKGTGDLPLCTITPSPLSHAGEGKKLYLKLYLNEGVRGMEFFKK